MQIGMIGLGRMGANMVRRLLKRGHQCVVFDRSPTAVTELTEEKAHWVLLARGICQEAYETAGGVVDGSRGGRGLTPSRISCPISRQRTF